MKQVVTPTGEAVLLDDEDFDRLPGKVSMRSRGGYPQVCPPGTGRSVALHRWLMGCAKGDGRIVDHINRDRLDNRRENLRFVTPGENTQNRTSGPLRGASKHKNSSKWYARVKVNGKNVQTHGFATAEEAAARAAEMRRELLSPVST